jgi:hypothetical protein
MAVRRKKRASVTNRRRANTRRHTSTSGTVGHRRTNRRKVGIMLNRRRRSNPVIHRRRRRSNPALTGVVQGSFIAFAGMALTDFIQGIIPINLGGPWGRIGVRLATAYALGVGAERFGFKQYANLLAIGGAVGAAQDAFRLLMGGGGVLQPAQPIVVGPPQQLAMADPEGVGDIIYGPTSMGEIVYAPSDPGLYQ